MSFQGEVASEIIRKFSVFIIYVNLIVFFLIVSLAMWLFVSQIRSNAETSDSAQIAGNIARPANWFTYRNYDLGFEIMYPRNAELIKREDGRRNKVRLDLEVTYSGLFRSKYAEISTSDEGAGFCDEEYGIFRSKSQTFLLRDMVFKKIEVINSEAAGASKVEHYYIKKGARCYELDFIIDFSGANVFSDSYHKREAEIFGTILRTFSFVE